MEEPNSVDPEAALVRLTSNLKVSDLMREDGAVFELNFDDLASQEPEELSYHSEDLHKHISLDACDLVDEDTYEDGEPFEKIAAKMENVIEDGGVKKRILRAGNGSSPPPEKSIVTVDYNAYLEYNDEPFDSTYLRKKSHTFRLQEGGVIPGLDIAVSSMRLNEQAQFLIQPRYAYGAIGCLQRVPPNSTVLFEILLKRIVDSGAVVGYPELNEEEQKGFAAVWAYAHALCSKGNDAYKKGLHKQAIRDYNVAAAKLEFCRLSDYHEQEKQQALLLRLFTNLAVAYTKIQEPRRACTNCNKVYNICNGTTLQIPSKVYFNHARSLILLSDFEHAERQLKKAQRLEPQSTDITKEFLILDKKKKESYNRELAMAKALFRNNEINQDICVTTSITKEFRDAMRNYCLELLGDAESAQYNLPDDLTQHELDFCRSEVKVHKLEFKTYEQDNQTKYSIAKPASAEQTQ